MSALRKLDALPKNTIDNQVLDLRPIEERVGNTPLIGFRRVTSHLPDNVNILAKAEWHNPGGSVKDRAALEIVRQALQRGDLGDGQVLTDSTSGNTGIAYAMLGAALGFGVRLFLPENASQERIQILRAYGVDLEFTDPMEGSDGSIRAVRQLVKAEPEHYFYANQYDNPANWQAHYKTTAVEIWEQTAGQITHFVAGLGTSGTLMGNGRRLRELNPSIQIISSQPDTPFHGIEGWKHMSSAIQPGIYDSGFADANLTVTTEASYEMARQLARQEGYLIGPSGAAALVSAIEVAENLAERGESGLVVTILPDNASKYLSDSFWQE